MSLYFERMFWWHYPIVILAAFLKWKVFAFDIDLKMKQKRGMRFFLSRGWVERIVAHHYPFGRSHTQAIEAAEHIVDKMNKHSVLKTMARMYGDDEVILVFKRCLAEKLSVLFSMQSYFSMNKQVGYVWLIPGSYCAYMSLLKEHGVTSPFPATVRLIGQGYGARMTSSIFGFLSWFLLIGIYCAHFVVQLFRKASMPRKHFKYGISLASAWFEKFKGGPREFTFLVDDKLITKDESAFLIEYPNSASFYNRYRQQGFHLFSALRPRKARHIFEGNILNASDELRCIPSLLLHSWKTPFIRESVMVLLMVRFIWGRTLAVVQFEKYVYTNKEDKYQIAANFFFRALGIKTLCYSSFFGGPYQLDGEATPFDERRVNYSFLNCDCYAVNHRALVRSLSKHYQAVKSYEIIGNIFSEMVNKTDLDKARCSILGEGWDYLSMRRKHHIIALFDTSYVDLYEVYSNYEEAIGFLEDMIELAKSHIEDIYLFKPSKPDEYFFSPKSVWASPEKGWKIVRLRKSLGQLPNVVFLVDSTDPVEVIALSDVVITNVFSSPTADALGAGKTAFWYESGNKTRGYPQDLLSDLVVHGRDQLIEKMDGIFKGGFIQEASNQKLFSELVDPYLDGHGLTRLRRLISER